MRAIPKLNMIYWGVLIAASIFGTNTGDFLSEYLKLGNVTGLPYLLVLLAGIFIWERFSPVASAAFFWAAIIVIRTGATNIADWTHQLGIYGLILVPLIIAAFVFAVRYYAARLGGVVRDAPKVDAVYWLCMALAGIVGTLLGDFSSAGLALASYGIGTLLGTTTGGFSFSWFWVGQLIGSVIFGLAMVYMFRRHGLTGLARPAVYWTMIALIRTAGTAMGDFLAHTSLTLPGSTVLTGVVFVGLVYAFYVQRRGNQALAA